MEIYVLSSYNSVYTAALGEIEKDSGIFNQ